MFERGLGYFYVRFDTAFIPCLTRSPQDGSQILSRLGIPEDDLWKDNVVLISMIIGFYLLGFICLKYSKRG